MDIIKKLKGLVTDKLILVSIISAIFIFFFLINYTLSKEVVIRDVDTEIQVKTMAFTVKDVFKRSEIELAEEDKLDCNLEDPLKDGMVINITRAEKVLVIEADTERVITTAQSNVADILRDNNIQVSDKDIIKPSLTEDLGDKRTIKIIRVIEKEVTEKIEVPFDTIVTFNNTLKYDEYNIKSQGENGLKEVLYTITYEDGKEISREVKEEHILKPKVNKIIEKAEEKYLVSSRGKVIRYKNVMIMESTAYDLSVGSTGKTPDHPEYGITFSGTRARPGVVAVDPRVIPLGSKLYVESLDSTKDYGVASAEDTGSAIKGKKIDLFMENSKEAWRYGRRKVRVYILE